MLPIPAPLQTRFEKFLDALDITANARVFYKKWLRFYLDFCRKYNAEPARKESLSPFLLKLQEKKLAKWQLGQASHAISLYYETIKSGNHDRVSPPHSNPLPQREEGDEKPPGAFSPVIEQAEARAGGDKPAADRFHLLRQPEKEEVAGEVARASNKPAPQGEPTSLLVGSKNTDLQRIQRQPSSPAAAADNPEPLTGASWQTEFTRLAEEIKVRHYSPKTLRSYQLWLRKFQAFTRSKPPESLSVTDVKEFLTWLAVKRQVSASTQNQAFNGLLFFYRHVLQKEFGKVEGVVRAKRRPYIPVVLTREEIETILSNLTQPFDLVAKLLYGCGLRLFECLNLRVQSLNFEAGIITIHDGKGQKDRTVPLPEVIVPDLKAQLKTVGELHQRDLSRKYGGVFLVNSLEKKYPQAAREFVWQWLFPAKDLTRVPETREYRRYHLHETLVQKAIREAVGKARLTKRASAHTFRHSFASHLLQANYDIRTIQELLGHSDVRTTMIYTHTIESRTLKEKRSPLDF
jgi:integron integrase